MCSLSDDQLRQAGSRNVTELVMSLIKEPSPVKALFDRDYLRLSYKYFICSTLKIRIAGLQQLNVSSSYTVYIIVKHSICSLNLLDVVYKHLYIS